MAKAFELWRSAIHLPSAWPETVNGLPDGRLIEGVNIGWASGGFPMAGGMRLYAQFVDPFGTPFSTRDIIGGSSWVEPQFQRALMLDPATTVLDDGRVVFTWEQAADRDNLQPQVQAFLYDPVTRSTTGLYISVLGTGATYSAYSYGGYAIDHIGNKVLQASTVAGATEGDPTTGMYTSTEIRVSLFDTQTTDMLGGQANTTTAGRQYDPDIAPLATGFVAAWTDDSATGGDTSGTALRARLFGADAAPTSGEFLVNASTDGDQQNVALAPLSGGGFVAVYQSRASTGSLGWDIRAQRFDAAGARVGAEIAVNAITGGEQQSPAVHAFADGSWLVAWTYNDAWVEAQYFDASGNTIGGEFRVGVTAQAHARVAITETSDGRVLVTWNSTVTGTTGQESSDSDGQFLDNRPAQIYGSSHGDVVLGHDAGQATVDDVLVTGAGSDTLYGLAGNDYLYCGADNDVAIGGTGNDVLLGEDGADTLYGEDGADTLYGGAGTNVFVGGAGVDVLISQGASDTLYGGDGGDYLYAYGTGTTLALGEGGNDIFVMQSAPARAWGGEGNDYFYMGASADEMHGDAGVDVLQGGGGNDTYDGGAGTDYLFLGTGSDTVIFNMQSGVDVVNDFDVAHDVLRLQGTAFTSVAQVQAATTDYGSFCIVTLDANTAVWLIGVTPSQLGDVNIRFA